MAAVPRIFALQIAGGRVNPAGLTSAYPDYWGENRATACQPKKAWRDCSCRFYEADRADGYLSPRAPLLTVVM